MTAKSNSKKKKRSNADYTGTKGLGETATPVKKIKLNVVGTKVMEDGIHPVRVIAQIRCWDEEQRKFSKYRDVTISDATYELKKGIRCWSYQFKHGGTLTFYPNFVKKIKREQMASAICDDSDKSINFRQYKVQGENEPRLHYMLAPSNRYLTSNEKSDMVPSYKYHSTSMKAIETLDSLPMMRKLSKRAAKLSGLKYFNIGADIVLYRSFRDGIGYHADDTQNEKIIFCVVLESKNDKETEVRPIHLKRPKRQKLVDSDEEVLIFAGPGDAYAMDGEMQKHYHHSLKKNKKSEKLHRRLAVVFRQGEVRFSNRDGGAPSGTLHPPRILTQEEINPRGRMHECLEVGGMYKRHYLLHHHAISSRQGGVSGNSDHGAVAVIVSRMDKALGELEDNTYFRYSANSRQGGGALFTSYEHNYPIRVFRSSKLLMDKAPEHSMYRYDGLYDIVQCSRKKFEDENECPPQNRPSTNELITYELNRIYPVATCRE